MFKIKLEYWNKGEIIQAKIIHELLIKNKACHNKQIKIIRKKD